MVECAISLFHQNWDTTARPGGADYARFASSPGLALAYSSESNGLAEAFGGTFSGTLGCAMRSAGPYGRGARSWDGVSRRLRRVLKMFCYFLPAPTKKRFANAKDTPSPVQKTQGGMSRHPRFTFSTIRSISRRWSVRTSCSIMSTRRVLPVLGVSILRRLQERSTRSSLRAVAAVVVLLTSTLPARADVIAPNANTAVEGNTLTLAPFQIASTFQWVFAASELSSVPTGSLVTGIGFRLDGGRATGPAAALNFSRWDLQLSQSLNAPGALDVDFADNIGPDVVTVHSGPLTIPTNFFTGDASPNAFATIVFTTPYTYTGGNLLLTLREVGGVANPLSLDAVSLPLAGTDSVGVVENADATSGAAHQVNVPVTAFTFTPPAAVPAPATLLLLVSAVAVLGTVRAWRRR